MFQTDLGAPNPTRGKVRDLYDLSPDEIGSRKLLIATDRISVFDVVLATPIPSKGSILTEIAAFWLRWIEARGLCKTHLLSTDADELPDALFTAKTTRDDMRGRIMITRACRVLPIEFVVRGYIEGSGWKDYQKTGAICGIGLPKGLRRCDRLPEPIFTPATKAEQGEHDENISFDQACEVVGKRTMDRLAELSMTIYAEAREHAQQRGIIIADTKFEFGIPLDVDGNDASDEPILIDEALTPDSSRFWPADDFEPGRAQRSFDKQYVRDFLQGACDRGEWDKAPPGPVLPDEVVQNTIAKYREVAERLTS